MAVYNQEKFDENLPVAFDGFFDWDWTGGCFGELYIRPMDIDGIVERNGNFIIFETKSKGNPVPQGQYIMLSRLYSIGVFTVVFCDKLNPPTQMSIWAAPGFINGQKMPCKKGDDKKYYPEYADISNDPDRARNFIKNWYKFADDNAK